MEGQHAQMFVRNSGHLCAWKAALYVDRTPTADSAACTHERSPSRLSESHSGRFSVTTPPLFFPLKASPKSTFYPDWRRRRCNRLRLISSTSECLAASAQTWTLPIELSPLGRSLVCWLIKYWQVCGYTMNVEQGVDRGRLLFATTATSNGSWKPAVVSLGWRKHARHGIHQKNTRASCFIQTGFTEPPLVSSRNEGGETGGLSGGSRLLPLRKQQQQIAAVIKEQRWGKTRCMNTSWCLHGSRSLMP